MVINVSDLLGKKKSVCINPYLSRIVILFEVGICKDDEGANSFPLSLKGYQSNVIKTKELFESLSVSGYNYIKIPCGLWVVM